MSKILDTDKDKLDDRLVGPDTLPAKDLEFSALIDRIENVRLVNLPSEILQDMHEDLVKEQEDLRIELGKLEAKLHRNLVRGNASYYEEARKETRKYSKIYEDLEDYRVNIYDARQQRIVREGVVGYLGSEFKANVVEATVMVMIVTILSIMSKYIYSGKG